MTKKQFSILQAALVLFAKEGYHATSTSKVAKKAGVSEGLIFRHFTNKEGLVNAIIKDGDEKLHCLFTPIITEENPKKALIKTIELPFNIDLNEHNFWTLHFKLKWELKYDSAKKMKSLRDVLVKAFNILRYKHPELEADFMIQSIESVSAAILKNEISDQDAFKNFLLNKYHLL